jgi:hypothetical protein
VVCSLPAVYCHQHISNSACIGTQGNFFTASRRDWYFTISPKYRSRLTHKLLTHKLQAVPRKSVHVPRGNFVPYPLSRIPPIFSGPKLWARGFRMATREEIEKNQIDLQVHRLELLQQKHSTSAAGTLLPIETALALAYIARELAKRP